MLPPSCSFCLEWRLTQIWRFYMWENKRGALSRAKHLIQTWVTISRIGRIQVLSTEPNQSHDSKIPNKLLFGTCSGKFLYYLFMRISCVFYIFLWNIRFVLYIHRKDSKKKFEIVVAHIFKCFIVVFKEKKREKEKDRKRERDHH